jgi:hypothetical protein
MSTVRIDDVTLVDNHESVIDTLAHNGRLARPPAGTLFRHRRARAVLVRRADGQRRAGRLGGRGFVRQSGAIRIVERTELADYLL